MTKHKLWHTYVKAPLNFSTLTGWRYPGIPRLKGNFLIGRLGRLFTENGILENISAAGELASKHPSGMCYFWIGTQLALLITRVDDIYELKVKYDAHLSRDLPLLEKFAGASIFTDDRETWRKKRHICQQATAPKALEKLAPGMQQVVDGYIQAIKAHGAQPVQLRTLFYNWVVDMVTANLMGCRSKSFECKREEIAINALSPVAHYLSGAVHDVFEFRSVFKWMLPAFIRKLFFRHELNDFERLKKDMKARYYEVFLNPNRTNILANENLLQKIWLLNHANSHHSGEPSNEEIFGDGLFLLSAGVATTVATLEFIIKLLAAHPECVEKLRAEIKHAAPDGNMTLANIQQMPYLEMIIKEAMRLYPPVPLFLPREIISDTEINGLPLFKGDIPMVAAYITHRSPDLWEQPEAFIPERFAAENADNMPKNAYMPFSIGPRFCAGQQFALQEMKLILAGLYLTYGIEIENNTFEVSLKQGGLAPKQAPVAHFSLD